VVGRRAPRGREAAIAYLRWHDLRHTFASRLVMSGVDVYRVKQLLGHGSVVTTERYAHLSARHLAAAVEKLAGVTKSDTAAAAHLAPDAITIQ
jgi:site-specific recombinase XerC